MKAVAFHGVGETRLEDVPEPKIKDPNDAIVRVTASAVCGTDLHLVRGTVPGMKPGTILGHEGAGVVEDLGRSVRSFKEGDRVVICSTIACEYCSYCRDGSMATLVPSWPKFAPAIPSLYSAAGPSDLVRGGTVNRARF